MARLGLPLSSFIPSSSPPASLLSSLPFPFPFFFPCALSRGAQGRLLQFPAVAAALVARPGPWCATRCGAVLSGTVSLGRPFRHLAVGAGELARARTPRARGAGTPPGPKPTRSDARPVLLRCWGNHVLIAPMMVRARRKGEGALPRPPW